MWNREGVRTVRVHEWTDPMKYTTKYTDKYKYTDWTYEVGQMADCVVRTAN